MRRKPPASRNKDPQPRRCRDSGCERAEYTSQQAVLRRVVDTQVGRAKGADPGSVPSLHRSVHEGTSYLRRKTAHAQSKIVSRRNNDTPLRSRTSVLDRYLQLTRGTPQVYGVEEIVFNMFVMHGYTKIQVVLNPNPSQKMLKQLTETDGRGKTSPYRLRPKKPAVQRRSSDRLVLCYSLGNSSEDSNKVDGVYRDSRFR